MSVNRFYAIVNPLPNRRLCLVLARGRQNYGIESICFYSIRQTNP